MWCVIVSISDLCLISYFERSAGLTNSVICDQTAPTGVADHGNDQQCKHSKEFLNL